jgi:hypothetical protein
MRRASDQKNAKIFWWPKNLSFAKPNPAVLRSDSFVQKSRMPLRCQPMTVSGLRFIAPRPGLRYYVLGLIETPTVRVKGSARSNREINIT